MVDYGNRCGYNRKSVYRTSTVCALCGSVPAKSTVDHVIPLTILKWNNCVIEDFDKVKKDINSRWNLVLMCESCNHDKAATILSRDEVSSLYIDEEQKQVILSKLDEYKPYINGYHVIEQHIYNKYHGRCQCGCGLKVGIGSMCIMRKNTSYVRSEQNAVLINASHGSRYQSKRWRNENRMKVLMERGLSRNYT